MLEIQSQEKYHQEEVKEKIKTLEYEIEFLEKEAGGNHAFEIAKKKRELSGYKTEIYKQEVKEKVAQ